MVLYLMILNKGRGEVQEFLCPNPPSLLFHTKKKITGPATGLKEGGFLFAVGEGGLMRGWKVWRDVFFLFKKKVGVYSVFSTPKKSKKSLPPFPRVTKLGILGLEFFE